MIDLEQRLADRLQARADAYDIHPALDAVMAGIDNVVVTDPTTNRRRRWPAVVAAACVAAAASLVVAAAVLRPNETDATVPAADPTQPVVSLADGSPFAPFVGDAPLVEAQRIDGATLYIAPALIEGQTCLLIELDESSTASCADASTIDDGDFWLRARTYPETPQLLAGIVPDDITAVAIGGATVPVVNQTWALFTTGYVDSYTLLREGASVHTVRVETGDVPSDPAS